MEIKWWGHSCFEIRDHLTIVTDPHPGQRIGLPKPRPSGEIAIISHDHYDHNATSIIKNEPTLVKEKGNKKIKGIKISSIETSHDEQNGELRGKNLATTFRLNNKNFTHLGDLGEIPSDEVIKELKETEILFIPVGGNFTINAEEATSLVKKIDPRIVIPMHYKVPGLNVPIDRVDEFKNLNTGIEEVNNPYKLPKELPEETQIKIIEPTFLK